MIFVAWMQLIEHCCQWHCNLTKVASETKCAYITGPGDDPHKIKWAFFCIDLIYPLKQFASIPYTPVCTVVDALFKTSSGNTSATRSTNNHCKRQNEKKTTQTQAQKTRSTDSMENFNDFEATYKRNKNNGRKREEANTVRCRFNQLKIAERSVYSLLFALYTHTHTHQCNVLVYVGIKCRQRA